MKYVETSILYDNNIEVDVMTEKTILAMEAYIDNIAEDVSIDYLFEAEEGNVTDGTSKFRKALNKITGAFKKKDKKAFEDAEGELNEAISDVNSEIESADTPEEKKRLSKKAKIIIGALAVAVTASVGIANADKIKSKLDGMKSATDKDPAKATKDGMDQSKGFVGAMKKAFGNAKSKVDESKAKKRAKVEADRAQLQEILGARMFVAQNPASVSVADYNNMREINQNDIKVFKISVKVPMPKDDKEWLNKCITAMERIEEEFAKQGSSTTESFLIDIDSLQW